MLSEGYWATKNKGYNDNVVFELHGWRQETNRICSISQIFTFYWKVTVDGEVITRGVKLVKVDEVARARELALSEFQSLLEAHPSWGK